MSMLEVALALAGRGFAVLPVEAKGKVPLVANGHEAAVRDPEIIRGWWEKWPEANVGITTGRLSGVSVVDVGQELDAEVRALVLAAMPRTLRVRTGHGEHFYFSAPEGGPSELGRGLLLGLDVYGDGRHVVGPGSTHPTGATYETSEDAPLAPLPAWVARVFAQGPAYLRRKAEDPGQPDYGYGDCDICALEEAPTAEEADLPPLEARRVVDDADFLGKALVGLARDLGERLGSGAGAPPREEQLSAFRATCGEVLDTCIRRVSGSLGEAVAAIQAAQADLPLEVALPAVVEVVAEQFREPLAPELENITHMVMGMVQAADVASAWAALSRGAPTEPPPDPLH